MSEFLAELKNITKTFSGVTALNKVSFNLKPGEVHALLGENGAGKSTLMKILSGIYQPDEGGQIIIDGKEVQNLTPKMAQTLGVAIIHQELNMCQHLTVAENMFLGREDKKGFIVNNKLLNEKARKNLEALNIDIDPTEVMSKLSVSKQQMVEIAKALSTNAKILIMDEPTSALTDKEIEDLFKIIHKLKVQGKGIVYISHRLEELKFITDRVTVFRDSNFIVSKNFNEMNQNEMIAYMVGREIKDKFPRVECEKGNKIFEVKHLSTEHLLDDINFSVYEGEIIAFSGLMGAGRTELSRAIFGADKVKSGEMYLENKLLTINSPSDAIREGIVCAPEDRKKDGLCVRLPIRENISLANMDLVTKFGFVQKNKEIKLANKVIEDLKIKASSIMQDAANLSGGNQQKVVIGKWLVRNAKLVIFDEPTRGIDVAAKVEIYNLMNELKKQGIAVIYISSEMPEVLGMSDKVIVMCNGRITAELETLKTTQEEIMHYATQYNKNEGVKKYGEGC